jgi:tripartite-type tricarboxylate transporter receptor subunit TctC
MAVVLAAIGALAQTLLSALAADTAPYQWKNLSLYIGTTTGGGYDLYARLLARYIGKYLPGQPAVTPINRPGAGGLSLMNQFYASAAQDGTEIASAAPGFIVDRVLYGDQSHAQFDAAKFNWLGSISADPSVFMAWRSKGFTFQDVLAGRPMNVGTPGPGGSPWLYSRALNALFGTHLQIISGYPGVAQVYLAIENGELDGLAGVTWNGLTASRPNWFASNSAQILVQYTKQPLPQIPGVPMIGEFIKDQQTAEIFDVIEQLDAIKYPVFAPPNVPAERVALLRQAFDKATRDPDLLAEASRLHLPISPVAGIEMQDIVKQIADPPDAIVRRLRTIYAD